MESALTISASAASARRNARLDLPLAVGPAISQMRGSMYAITLVSPDPEVAASAYHNIRATTKGEGRQLGPGAWDVIAERRPDVTPEGPVDVCIQPVEHRRKRLLVADMDSTIIN